METKTTPAPRKPGRPRKTTTASAVQHTDTQPKEILGSSIRQDNWENTMTGLGQLQDKATKTRYSYSDVLTQDVLTEMYVGGGLAARIVNVVADDMTREWLWLDDEETRKVVESVSQELGIEENVNTALRWQRLNGGSLVVIGAMDGRKVDQPLDIKKIKSIEYLRPVSRNSVDLGASEWNTDENSPRFGKIEKYNIRYKIFNGYKDVMVHWTRVVEFHNDPCPSGKFSSIDDSTTYWGMSSLQVVNESLRDIGGVSQSTVNILYDFVSGVYKFKNLGQLIATDEDGSAQAGLVKRMNAINASKSIINAIVLDTDEQYDKQYTTVAGLPEIIDRYMLQLSGSSGIPVTRLYGRSPAGLNATGESDLRNYYDLIEAQQRNRLYNPLSYIIKLILAWKGIDEGKCTFSFNSLYQLTETEKSELAKTDAETEQIKTNTYINQISNGLRDITEIAEENGWSVPEEPIPPEPATKATSGDNPVNTDE